MKAYGIRLLRWAAPTVVAFLLASSLMPADRAIAQGYPNKPIRFVVPYGPGGATDIVARIVGEHLKQKFGQPVIVENKPGGAGVVGMNEVVRSKPDGYTFLVSNITPNLLTPLIGDPPMPFDPFKAFTPVAEFVEIPGIFLATMTNFPPNTVKEVVEYARARPGEVNHSTAGIFAYSHIDFLMLQKRTGTRMVAVPLRAGAGGGQIDMLNGTVQIALQNAATVMPLVKSGKLKALAVTGEKRLAVLPDVPTMKEAGFEGIGTNAWHGMFAHADVSVEILDLMAKTVTEILASEAVQKQLEDLQFTVAPPRTRSETQRWLENEVKTWTPIIADAKEMYKKTQ